MLRIARPHHPAWGIPFSPGLVQQHPMWSIFGLVPEIELKTLLGTIVLTTDIKAVFYLICGFAAAIGQIVMDTSSVIPMLGASGAISGVLGGYLLLFPNKQVRAIMFNFVMTTIPAFIALGLWFGFQILQGYLSSSEKGGVAYAAHIGGFVAGVVLIKLFALGKNEAQ